MFTRKNIIRTISRVQRVSLFGGIMCIICFLNPQSVCAGDVSETLGKCIALYEKGDFNKAIHELKNVIRELELTSVDKARNEELYNSNLYLGLSYLGKGQESLARGAFKKAIAAAPDKTLDPELFPPKVISLYHEVISQSLSNLSVQSNIHGAEVFIEDTKKGNTPLVIHNLPPGTYTVRVTATGQDIVRIVTLEPGKNTDISAQFQNTGSLHITSDPSAATVYLGGKAIGTTPLFIKDFAPGEYLIAVSKEKYNELKKPIMVKANETADALFTLLPVTYLVRIFSEPENSEVFWDGKAKGITPVTIENVSSGVHMLRVVKADHDAVLDSLDVQTPLTEKTYTLVPHKGSLSIKTEPSGVEVIMNDKKAGLTPLSIAELPVRQYTVTLKKDGYLEKKITVDILRDKTAEITENLTQVDTQLPTIIFEPPAKFVKENNNLIKAHISDNQSVREAFVMVRAEGMTNFRRVDMALSGKVKNMYEAVVPDPYLKKDSVFEYYLSACDAQNNCKTAGSKDSPHKIRVTSLEPYTEGFILDASGYGDDVHVTISLGSLDGLQKGDKYIVFRAGRELRDPKTNDLLQIEESFIGTIAVKELMPHTASAKVPSAVKSIARNDRIRKVPAAPSDGSLEGDYATKVVLRWAPNHEPEVEGYRIYRSSTAAGSYQKIGEISGRDNIVYEDTDDMREGLSFYYRITAFNILRNESLMSEPVIGKTKKVGPPPKNLRSEGVRVREVVLSWDIMKHDPDIKSYVIYRSNAGDGEFREIAREDSDTGTYTDRKDFEDGKTYFYKIAVRSRHGSTGELSSAVEARTKDAPAPPQKITAASGLARMVKVQWDKHADTDVVGYVVYRNLKEANAFTKIGKTEKTEFLDKELSDGVIYSYKLSSCYSVRGDEIIGPQSQPVSATTKQRPKAPAQVSAESGHARKTVLKWTKNDDIDITEYWVYRGKEAGLDRDPFTKVPGNLNTFIDENLNNNTKYYYAIKAVDIDGLQSDMSNTVSALTKPLPKPPTGLKGQGSHNKMHLEWKANEETDIKGYNIYKKGWLKSTLVTTVDRNLYESQPEEKIKSITLYITAIDKDGLESEPSEEIKIEFE